MRMSPRNIFSLFIIIFCITKGSQTYDFTWTKFKLTEVLGELSSSYKNLMSFYKTRKNNVEIKKCNKIVADEYRTFQNDIAVLEKYNKILKSDITNSNACFEKVINEYKQMIHETKGIGKFCYSYFQTYVKNETIQLQYTLSILEVITADTADASIACWKLKGADYDKCCRQKINDEYLNRALQCIPYTKERDAYIFSIMRGQKNFLKCMKKIEPILSDIKRQMATCNFGRSKSI